jgi:hypothetical protein
MGRKMSHPSGKVKRLAMPRANFRNISEFLGSAAIGFENYVPNADVLRPKPLSFTTAAHYESDARHPTRRYVGMRRQAHRATALAQLKTGAAAAYFFGAPMRNTFTGSGSL